MSETRKFQHIIEGISEDLTFVENLHWKLHWNLIHNQLLKSDLYYDKTAVEIKEWIYDVLLDKIYEINSKVEVSN